MTGRSASEDARERAQPSHPRLSPCYKNRTWMPAPSARMTIHLISLLPVGALLDSLACGGRLFHQLGDVDRGQLAVALEDAAVDQNGVDVRGLRRIDEHVGGFGERPDVDITGAHHDDVGALAF